MAQMQKKIVFVIHFGTTQFGIILKMDINKAHKNIFSEEEVTMREQKQNTTGFVEGAVVHLQHILQIDFQTGQKIKHYSG